MLPGLPLSRRCRHSLLCLSGVSMVSSTVLMYLQPALLSALAGLMNWPHLSHMNPVRCTSLGTVLARTLQLHWRLTTASSAGIFSSRTVRAPSQLVRLAVQSAI